MPTFKEINLQVGTRVQMALQQGAKQSIYYSELIGYLDGEYVILKTPVVNGLSIQLQVEEPVVLRILSGVDVLTMKCRVKTVFRAPHSYMHLTFPTNIQSVALRGAIRANVKLPVIVNGGIKAVITDISVTGAQITTDQILGELNEETILAFDFPIKPTNQIAHIDTTATIRSTNPLPSKNKDAPPRYTYGVSFHDIEPTSQVMLLNLVYESMNKITS